jgi:hypothetical protein
LLDCPPAHLYFEHCHVQAIIDDLDHADHAPDVLTDGPSAATFFGWVSLFTFFFFFF